MTAKKLKGFSAKQSRFNPALFGVFILLAACLAGCSPTGQKPDQAATKEGQPFRPATAVNQTPSPAAAQEAPPQPKATPNCLDNLTWVSDQTIPDGSEVEAQSTLDKRWEVKNSGNCNWDEHYRLRLTAGPGMSAVQEQSLIPARAGTTAVIRIVFKAPAAAGKYRSAWQAYNPDGHAFGDPVFIDIVVK